MINLEERIDGGCFMVHETARGILTLCFFFLLGWQAEAKEMGPQEIIQKIFETAKQPGIATSVPLQNSLNSLIDFEQMAQSVLDAKTVGITAADQKWFADTLKAIITKTVYPKASGFFSGVKVSYQKVNEAAGKASLSSTLQKKGEDTAVLYRFRKIGEDWRVVDIAIDDESWVDSIRGEVQDVLKKSQWPGLKKKLQEKLAKLETTKKKK